MAAAAVVSAGGFNHRTQAAYPIRLGASLTNNSKARGYSGVRYNFKPSQGSDESTESHIKPATDEGDRELLLDRADGTYTYSGRDVQDEESFVLLLRGQGKEQEMVLERIDSCFGFDIIKTPSESNRAKLAKRYPPLPIFADDENGDDLFGDDDEDLPVDEANPFDYRHFLKAEFDKLESTSTANEVSRSSAGTPLVHAQASTRTSAPKATKRAEPKKPATTTKRKSATTEKSARKRVNAGAESQTEREAFKPKPLPVPELRVDRKASIRSSSVEDTGELILENDTTMDDKPHKHPTAMSLALSGQLGQGPISLRSAASSPASRIASPMPSRPAGMEEEYEFDLGDSSPGTSPAASRRASNAGEDEHEPHEQHGGYENDDDDDDDADVEDLQLPAPANQRPASNGTPPSPPPPTGGDDDDDLDKQLALAMAEDDDGVSIPLGHAESDEESEEE